MVDRELRKVRRVRVERVQKTLSRFNFDPDVFRQDATDQLLLSGWAVHPESRIAALHLGRGQNILASASPENLRPRVLEQWPGWPGADAAGFRMNQNAPGSGAFWLDAELETGATERLAQLKLVEEDQPRLLFMHIAKAAGSTVNSYFAGHFSPSRTLVHIESEPEWRGHKSKLERYDFLSGHVGLQALKRWLEIRSYRLVTVVRDPYAQLFSHLAWIRRLSDEGEEIRLARHPELIREFSTKLKDCDFTRAADLKRLISGLGDLERQLIDNCQTRYFAGCQGDWVAETDLKSAIEATRQFDHIGLAENLGDFLSRVAADMGWPEPQVEQRENVTRHFYGLEEAGMRVRRALKPLVRYDMQLYDYIRRNCARPISRA